MATETYRRYRRAADYIAATQIYLRDNILLREPLRPEHLKPNLLGHWGTCPGITFVYLGLNGLIRRTGAEVLLVTGPGHGAPANHANLWLEGSHADHDPALGRDEAGLAELVRRFSVPAGFPSHLSPEVPGVIHEGGELGYALATAFGAALDAPDRLVACIVGDGEAETGPTATAWHGPKYLDPATSGAVLPVLHLNRYKIASPTVFATMTDEEITELFRGCGWGPRIVDVDSTDEPDADLAYHLDRAHREIHAIQRDAREGRPRERPRWPMLVLKSPKGWGGIPSLHGRPVAGSFHAHQVPAPEVHTDPAELAALEEWLRSYRPDELFDAHGRPAPDITGCCPDGDRRLGAQPAANGGRLRIPLVLPPVTPHAPVGVEPGQSSMSPTAVLGDWLAEVMRASQELRNFRIVCPDELESNNLGKVLEVTPRAYSWPVEMYAEQLAPDGRVMEKLSEHDCQGWLQGYLLTGRHGLFPCYEAFVSIIDGMVNQYAKFLKMAGEVPWRTPVSSLTYLLTSEGWQQEHNGYSHQGPGFINQILTKKGSVARVYLPPDASTLLVTMEHCLTSTDLINVVIASKHPAPVWLDLDAARTHCRAGAGVWDWAGTVADGQEPRVVLACAGGVPTIETLAAAQLLRADVPELAVRVVNVVDLLALSVPASHPHGLSDEAFRDCFGEDLEVVFDFHGYPAAVHQLLHGRPLPDRFHVRGYIEEGTTTTPFDLLIANRVTRYHLAAEALRRLPDGVVGADTRALVERYEQEVATIRAEILRTATDPQAIREWRWMS